MKVIASVALLSAAIALAGLATSTADSKPASPEPKIPNVVGLHEATALCTLAAHHVRWRLITGRPMPAVSRPPFSCHEPRMLSPNPKVGSQSCHNGVLDLYFIGTGIP
jgi:hypothetical protein